MEKQLVVVVIVNVDEEQLNAVEQSLTNWKDSAAGAYAAHVRLEKVNMEG